MVFQNGKRVAFFPLISFRMLTFNKVEEVQHIIVIPSTSHSGINYPPPALGWRSTLSLQKGAAYCMLSFCQLSQVFLLQKRTFRFAPAIPMGCLALVRQLISLFPSFLYTCVCVQEGRILRYILWTSGGPWPYHLIPRN